MRTPLMAGNWKMHKTVGEAVELVRGLKENLCDVSDREIVVLPPFTAIAKVAEELQGTNIKWGAQDVFWEDKGAFTGEVSPVMLKDLGCSYCVVGHSERRQYFHETNETVNKKVKALLRHGITPIMCVGEKLEERERGETLKVVENHVMGGLQDLSEEEVLKVVIAYEPVWAIGTGRTATPEDANEVHEFIRELIEKNWSKEVAVKIRILYGGSVKPENVDDLMAMPEIDGTLVGGASLNVDSFSRIVKFEKK